MKRFASLLLVSSLPSAVAAQTVSDADAAYGLFDVNKAESIYRQVAADVSASEGDRARANTELARIAWLVDGEPEEALSLLRASLPDDPDPCPAALLYARVSNDTAISLASDELAIRLSQECIDIEPAVALEVVRSLQIQTRNMSESARTSAARAALLRLEKLPDSARYSAEGASLQLSLGLLARDADAALAGWRNYFWLRNDETGPQAIELPVESSFRDGLAKNAATDDALGLAELLLRSGFYEEFLSYADVEGLAPTVGERWQPFQIYIDLRSDLSREILAHDRAYARRGGVDEEAYEARLTRILTEASDKLGSSETPLEVLRARYGLWGTSPGKTNGVSGIHLGHVVVDERQEVAQDGRSGTIRFISLDNMVHNSFSAWLMDGKSAPGGWAVDGATIVQIRPRYLELIGRYAALSQPGPARAQELERIDLQRVQDRESAEDNPIAFFPGVRSKLRLGAIDALAAEVRETRGPDENFELAFRRAYMDALVGSAITAHEGRHVLDQAQCRGDAALGNAELEFRAKLSELRFAPNAKLALSSIYSPLFGGTSGHGIANERLLRKYATWIGENSRQIEGYDQALAPLEQLFKLSDEQIRALAEELDSTISRTCTDGGGPQS